MSIPDVVPDPVARPASPPIAGAVRTTIGASAVATVLIAGIGISNPVLAGAAIIAGTGVLSYTGKRARDYLHKEESGEKRKGLMGYVASLFAWLG